MKPPEQWLPSASDMEDEETGRRQAEADGAYLDQLVEEERAACAELVCAAGCLCEQLMVAEGKGDGVGYRGSCHMSYTAWEKARSGAAPDDTYAGHVHDPRCPHALAAAILARRTP